MVTALAAAVRGSGADGYNVHRLGSTIGCRNMTGKIIAMTQASDWFYYQHDADAREPWCFDRVVVWASYDTGETRGLLSRHAGAAGTLAPPPAGADGGYIHWSELNPAQQREAVLQGKLAGSSHPASDWK